MSKIRLVTIVSIIAITAIAVTTLPVANAGSCCSSHGQKSEMEMKKPVMAKIPSLEKIYSGHLPMVSQSIDNAIKALGSGNKGTALAELNKAKQMITGINEAIGKLVKPKFANFRCPIMGSPIKPDKVAKTLIRDYKGQKIAFCCGGCPATWDKLTNAEKDAKLAKVKPTPKPMKNHSEHKH